MIRNEENPIPLGKKLEENCILEIKRSTLNKVRAWIREGNEELGGLMSLVKSGESKYKILEAYLPQQIVTPIYLRIAEADTNKIKSKINKEVMDFQKEIFAKFKDEKLSLADLATMESKKAAIVKRSGTLKCQWHSHVNMSTGKSGTDDNTALRICENSDFMFMMILNKKDEMTLYLYVREPMPVIIKDVELKIIEDNETEIYATAEQDVRENVFSEETHFVNKAGAIEERGNDENSKIRADAETAGAK